MTYEFKLTDVIPGTPQAIYDVWMSSRGHTAMTGGKARMSANVGGTYTAGDGYIAGKNLSLVPGARIVESWRTTDFTDADVDSKITVTLKAVEGGTEVTLKHIDVPASQTSYEKGGWEAYYFAPMKKYFANRKTRSKKR